LRFIYSLETLKIVVIYPGCGSSAEKLADLDLKHCQYGRKKINRFEVVDSFKSLDSTKLEELFFDLVAYEIIALIKRK